jgi:hypothetical protein
MLLLVAAVAAVYLGWVWVPLYLDNYAVKQTLRVVMNEAIKDHDDAALVQRLCQKIRSIRTVESVDEAGRKVQTPVVAIDEHQVSWTRDPDGNPPMLRVTIEYERQVVYPFVDRTDTTTFVVEGSNDLTPVKW